MSQIDSVDMDAPLRVRGVAHTPEYHSWYDMRRRCNNPKSQHYAAYGAVGIRVCKRWDSFENFLSDMGKRSSPKHYISRIDTNGDYEPGNCEWATRQEQAGRARRPPRPPKVRPPVRAKKALTPKAKVPARIKKYPYDGKDAVAIYMLCELPAHQVIYVGKTKNPKSRFKGHFAVAAYSAAHAKC